MAYFKREQAQTPKLYNTTFRECDLMTPVQILNQAFSKKLLYPGDFHTILDYDKTASDMEIFVREQVLASSFSQNNSIVLVDSIDDYDQYPLHTSNTPARLQKDAADEKIYPSLTIKQNDIPEIMDATAIKDQLDGEPLIAFDDCIPNDLANDTVGASNTQKHTLSLDTKITLGALVGSILVLIAFSFWILSQL